MAETTTTERTTEAAAPAPQPTPAAETTPVAQKPVQDATPKPRIPRAHCAC